MQSEHATMGSAGRGRGGVRFKAARLLAAYSHSTIAMMLPPGNDNTSGSKLPPMLCIRAAIRPALDSIKFIMSVSYTADRASCLNNICLGNFLSQKHHSAIRGHPLHSYWRASVSMPV